MGSVADTTFGFIFFVVFSFHFGADKLQASDTPLGLDISIPGCVIFI
jgi:hypothetical protein